MAELSRIISSARRAGASDTSLDEAERGAILFELRRATVEGLQANFPDGDPDIEVIHDGHLEPHRAQRPNRASPEELRDSQEAQGQIVRLGELSLVKGLWALGRSVDNPAELRSGDPTLITDYFIHQQGHSAELLKAAASSTNGEAARLTRQLESWQLMYYDDSEHPPKIMFQPIPEGARNPGEAPGVPTQAELFDAITQIASGGPQMQVEGVLDRFVHYPAV